MKDLSMMQMNSSVPSSNVSISPGNVVLHPSWDFDGLVPSVVLSFSFLLGVPGNIAVLVFRPNFQHLSSVSQKLMLNLVVSDLLCLLTLPLWIYDFINIWTFGLVACKILTFLVYCGIYGSRLTVTALSVQRYLLVVHQKTWTHQTGVTLLLVLLWLVSIILSIPALVVRQVTTDQNKTRCESQYSSEAQWITVLLTEALIGFTIFFVVVFSYTRLQKKVKRAAFFNNPQTSRLVTTIIVSLFALWVPFHFFDVLISAAILLHNENLLKLCLNVSYTVGALNFVNSCLNPFLYAFTSYNFCCKKRCSMKV
ncbi:C-C chemokine receptor type 8-like [Oryzias melastigma]|uniref:C-C chemokine receptor type 8-like n=1 Tax=Oryzias melastigma TaxID=30732 RepID=UPI00168CC80F|nr:C-C chemokine receptor type 8-like [Oryzias melastigma]